MEKDKRQLRTTNSVGLIGYRGLFHGKRCIAIMKGKECRECLGIVYPEQLNAMVDSGPCINLDEIFK